MRVSLFQRRFAAILVDWDGTILTSVAAAERAWTTWALSHGIEPGSFLSTIHGVQAAETSRRLDRPDLVPDREAAAVTRLEIADVDGVRSIPGAVAFLGAPPPPQTASCSRTRLSAWQRPKQPARRSSSSPQLIDA